MMLVAKSDEAHWRLARQFENRTIQKTYMAVVHGALPLLADVIDMPIGKDRYMREKQAVRKVENGGRPAVTKYEVQEKYNFGGQLFSLVKLTPKTGRTHQLRVHMTAIGFPMVGDVVYGGRVFETGGFRFDRQALHAAEITFIHPGTLNPMTLQAPMAADMRELIAHLQAK